MLTRSDRRNLLERVSVFDSSAAVELTQSVPFDVGAVGTCGQIQVCNEAKVVDVPEMGVSAARYLVSAHS